LQKRHNGPGCDFIANAYVLTSAELWIGCGRNLQNPHTLGVDSGEEGEVVFGKEFSLSALGDREFGGPLWTTELNTCSEGGVLAVAGCADASKASLQGDHSAHFCTDQTLATGDHSISLSVSVIQSTQWYVHRYDIAYVII